MTTLAAPGAVTKGPRAAGVPDARCEFCGCEITLAYRSTYHRHATGWVSAEANKSMVLMRPDGQVACNPCIRKLSHGVSPDQEALLP